MTTTLTRKGQVTVPKRIREALGLAPGSQVHFEVSAQGEIVLRKAGKTVRSRKKDRFEAARGKADIKWRTKDLMALLRADN
jgi:AbrB family looped-hinge helix DNA binding protein